jgi:hypothetical protein
MFYLKELKQRSLTLTTEPTHSLRHQTQQPEERALVLA